jgi:diguanylate cyclase (GGDEF)-like protein
MTVLLDPPTVMPAGRDQPLRTSTPDGGCGGLSPKIAWIVVAVYSVAIAVVAAGLAASWLYTVTAAVTVFVFAAGVWLNRPRLVWPLWAIVASGIFWALAAIARETTGSTGDLTNSRSLLPDLIALPGYLAYGAGLVALIRARDGRNRGALIDALVVGIGGFLLSWEFLISKTLLTDGVSTYAQVSIILYPALDCALVALACRLVFATRRRLPAHGWLLVSVMGVLIGDVAYVLDELEFLSLGYRRDLGYMLTAAALAATAMHPSTRQLHLPGPATRRALPTARALMLAISMLLPAALFIYGIDTPAVRALPFQVGAIALGAVASFRLLDSVRHQNIAADALGWRATHDSLTGLPNRAAITALIDEHIEGHSGEVIVAYFDLDHFKNINDALGHAYGDQLLTAVASRLRDRLPEDVVIGRIGGDEFVALCDAGRVDADSLALAITGALDEPFLVGGFEAATSASIGLTTTGGGRNADALLRDADTAMYRAKDAGRNTHAIFSDDMRTEVERRIRVESDLREALEKGEELCAWFQPIHDFRSGTVVGFEALARWVTPYRTVMPHEFIDVAEDTGLITVLGERILDHACSVVAEMQRTTGKPLFVSVNVSARQLADDSIIRIVTETLDRHRLAGASLCLEITESIMVNEHNVERLRALCRLGVWLAVDDFGTGYSSLSYLHRMPISKVKIDKAFVDEIAAGDASIMEAILSMAHSLGLTCVAEGVETSQQADRLLELGCDQAQGYLWSRPVPSEQLPDLMLQDAATWP